MNNRWANRLWLIALMLGLAWFTLNLRQAFWQYQWRPIDDTSDAAGYIYYGAVINGHMLHTCRQLLGEDASCGLKPSNDEVVGKYYTLSGLNDYLNGEATFAEFKSQYEGVKYGYMPPIEIGLSRWNFKSFETAITFWLVDPTLYSVFRVQMGMVALTSVFVFLFGYHLGGWRAGLVAGLIWALYPLTINGLILTAPQWGAALWLSAGGAAFARGFSRRSSFWLMIGILALTVMTLYLYAFRIFLMALFILIWIYVWRELKSGARWFALYPAAILIFMVLSFPARWDENTGFAQHAGEVIRGTAKLGESHRPTSVYKHDNFWPIKYDPAEFTDETDWVSRTGDYVLHQPTHFISHNLVGIYRFWQYPHWNVKSLGVWRGLPFVGAQYPDFQLGSIYHQFFSALGLLGIFWLLSYSDGRRWASLAVIGFIAATCATYALFSVEMRYTLALSPLVFAFGGVMLVGLGEYLYATRRLSYVAFILSFIFIFVLQMPYVLAVFPFLGAQFAYLLLMILRIIAFAGMVALFTRRAKLPIWQRLGIVIILLFALWMLSAAWARSDWSGWSAKVESAEQIAILPDELPQQGIPWLLIDLDDYANQQNFSIQVNGETIKTPEQSMFVWLDEAAYDLKGVEGLTTFWLALPLEPHFIQPNAELNIQISGENVRLRGAYLPSMENTYDAPTLVLDGSEHAQLRQAWNDEGRYPARIDLQGVRYEPPNGDLSPVAGRQMGMYSLLVQWQPLDAMVYQGEAPLDVRHLFRVVNGNTYPFWDGGDDWSEVRAHHLPYVLLGLNDKRVVQLQMQPDRFELLYTSGEWHLFKILDSSPRPEDDLFTQMNALISSTETALPWISRQVIPPDSLWTDLVKDWESLLAENPDSELAKYGLAFSLLQIGDHQAAYPYWVDIYTAYPDLIFSDEGRSVFLERLNNLTQYAEFFGKDSLNVLAPDSQYLRFYFSDWNINTDDLPTELDGLAGYDVFFPDQAVRLWQERGEYPNPLSAWTQAAAGFPLEESKISQTHGVLQPLIGRQPVHYGLYRIDLSVSNPQPLPDVPYDEPIIFADQLEMLGHALIQHPFVPHHLILRFYWRNVIDMPNNPTVFIHVVDAETDEILVQLDEGIVKGAFPLQYLGDATLTDFHLLEYPPELAGRRVEVRMGLYTSDGRWQIQHQDEMMDTWRLGEMVLE